MQNKNLYKRIVGIILCLNILLNIVPMKVNAANTSVPGAEGHILTNMVTGTFEGGYDSTILVYVTPNVSDSIQYRIWDNSGIFAVPTYDSANWYFAGWKTWYKGSHSGAGFITSDDANPKYDDNNNYFAVLAKDQVFGGVLYPTGSMDVLKEDFWKGTYYLSAIFRPILTVNAGEGISYNISGGSKVANDKYAVTYGNNASINYSINSKYEVKKISASYGTSYSDSNGKINLNKMERPTTITIETALKPKATYTAPTAKNLTYNGQEQELVVKGTSEEGILMYSLEENGTYKESIPMAKNVGKYKVWYYVKGDNEHNDSDKAFVEVDIKIGKTAIGTVSAEIPNDTTDISKVVLKRSDTSIPGILKVKDDQTLVYGDNEIEYIFTPENDEYEVVGGKVNVTVTDTIAPTGTVTISDAKPTVWDKVIETITFNLFFNTNQIVEVNVDDNLSGIDKLEYYESNKALDLTEIKTLADDSWKDMTTEGVRVTAEDEKRFVYYIRLSDKAGNMLIISTDGAVFDTSAPVISGVEDGKTYNTTQTIKITDKNLDKVTLNGEDVTDAIVLEEDEEGTYAIMATDKSGNSSTVTVKIEKLEDTSTTDPVNPDEDETETDKTNPDEDKTETDKSNPDGDDTEIDKTTTDDSDKEDTEKEDNKPIVNNPQTSDNIMLFVITALVSVIGIIASIKAKNMLKNN